MSLKIAIEKLNMVNKVDVPNLIFWGPNIYLVSSCSSSSLSASVFNDCGFSIKQRIWNSKSAYCSSSLCSRLLKLPFFSTNLYYIYKLPFEKENKDFCHFCILKNHVFETHHNLFFTFLICNFGCDCIKFTHSTQLDFFVPRPFRRP